MTTETRGGMESQDSDGAARRPLLTLFATPKVFTGSFSDIQRNALRSWKQLRPACQIVLVGDDGGAAEAAAEFDVEHEPEVARNDHGTPLLDDVFTRARARARGDLLGYVNADLVLGDDFTAAAARLQAWREPFLMVGQCWDVDASDLAAPRQLRGPDALDFFVFSPSLFREVPPFAIGRTGFDNWLLWAARGAGAALVDVTPSVVVVHQKHDYSHLAAGREGAYSGAETERNWELAGGKRRFYSLLDATHVLRPDGIHRRAGAVLRVATRWRSLRWYAGRAAARVRR